jgi:hypothetical protein
MNLAIVEEAVNQELSNEAYALAERFRADLTMIANGYRSEDGKHRRWTLQFGDHVYILVVLNWNERHPLSVGVSSGTNDVEEVWKARERARVFSKATYVATSLKRHLNRFLTVYFVMEA